MVASILVHEQPVADGCNSVVMQPLVCNSSCVSYPSNLSVTNSYFNVDDWFYDNAEQVTMEEHYELVASEVPLFCEQVPERLILKLAYPTFMVKLPYSEGMAYMHEVDVLNLVMQMGV